MYEYRLHSVKVPRLYKTAAKIAERVKLHGESVKQVYDDKLKHRNIKAIYALVISTVRNDSNLELLLKKSQLLQKEEGLEKWLAKVLIAELLWGKKRLSGDSKPIQTITAYQQIFNAYLDELEQPRNNKKKVDIPRYVRVNTLKISVNEAVDSFRDEGWNLVKFLDKDDYPGFLARISTLEESDFMVDIHIPSLLIFPPRTEFFMHRAYRDGLIALQDKASCLPAHILNPCTESKVLDMCAAPGMKTTQLACILNGTGVIYAVERDAKRALVLQRMIETSGAQDCVQILQRDVLDVCKRKGGIVLNAPNGGKLEAFDGKEQEQQNSAKDEDDIYRDVDYILVDPTCSASGMVEGPEKLGNFTTDQCRLKRLAGFQIMILKHALRCFPSAKRVVYSTCSINAEENEEVVREVLKSAQHFKLVDVKTLCAPWINFGSNSNDGIGGYCLYSRPDEDLTNGFFVAVFDRLENGEENQFLVQNQRHFEHKGVKNVGLTSYQNEEEFLRGATEINQNTMKKKKRSQVINQESFQGINDSTFERQIELGKDKSSQSVEWKEEGKNEGSKKMPKKKKYQNQNPQEINNTVPSNEDQFKSEDKWKIKKKKNIESPTGLGELELGEVNMGKTTMMNRTSEDILQNEPLLATEKKQKKKNRGSTQSCEKECEPNDKIEDISAAANKKTKSNEIPMNRPQELEVRGVEMRKKMPKKKKKKPSTSDSTTAVEIEIPVTETGAVEERKSTKRKLEVQVIEYEEVDNLSTEAAKKSKTKKDKKKKA